MTTVFYIHFNEEELNKRIKPLIEAGFDVRSHWRTDEPATFGEPLPDVIVLSLDRLPSHSRTYAEWIWEAKKRQHYPIIFVGGKKEKVAPIKEKFPKAHFCSQDKLLLKINSIKNKGE